MRISYNWLQEYFEEKLPTPEALAELITMHSFEIDSIQMQGSDRPQDWILDVKIMPDRAHDCLSYWGMAKEIGTLLDREVKPMIFPVEGDDAVKTSSLISLKIDDENKCRRAMKRVAIGVTVGPSPKWLKDRLESVSQRSINNIVDIANFVMLETGQPVHTFDLDKISDQGSHPQEGERPREVRIRNAKQGEKVKTLDGKEFTLDETMLVIADSTRALDIAGVKGGFDSGIDENTQNVLLSACNFEPINIRQTSKKLGLRTDASERFEKEISPALAQVAMDYLSFLIKEIGGGYLAVDTIDFYPKKFEAPQVHVSTEEINKLLGIKISKKEIEDIFRRLRFEFKGSDPFVITPPIERLDINLKEDILEEIARLYGYEKIPAILPVEFKGSDPWPKKGTDPFLLIEQARRQLLSEGYSEVYTYTFQNTGKVELSNPLAEDKKFLRANLTDGLKEAINFNIKNLALLDADEVKVFEIGTVFPAGKTPGVKDAPTPGVEEAIHVACGDKKGVKEMKLEEFTKNLPGVGPLAQEGVRPLRVVYKPISIYPFIVRDIAVWVPEHEAPEKLLNVIRDHSTDLLAREPKLFDKFSKEGRTSYAYRLVFQSLERTLTDDEVNKIMTKISLKIGDNSLWQIR
jgi:phenylalanyl-tRNA synthetase beta chain